MIATVGADELLMNQLDHDVDQLEALVVEFTERCRRGERPLIAEYVERFPNLSDSIHEFFPTIQSIEDLKSAVVSAVDNGADRALKAVSLFHPPQGPDEIGRIGSYRVLRPLGSGGMGAVFVAEDVRLHRTVALKVMLPNLATEFSARDRFLREARAAAALDDDHIVTIYQVDEDRGHPFIAMPLLKGENLDRRLRAGPPLTLAEIVRIGREVAEGLAVAHKRGLVHRDIKPANIWLERKEAGEAGANSPSLPANAPFRTKLLDFGLVRDLVKDGKPAHISNSGVVIGTPTHMAPEQARGEALDGRADLFSLGVVLYRMTTGQSPFQGASSSAVLMALAAHRPRDPIAINSAMPRALSDLIMRLLEKNPADRPSRANDVAVSLRRIEADLRDRSPKVNGVAAARRWPLWVILGVAVVLPLAIWLAGVALRVDGPDGARIVQVSDNIPKVSAEGQGHAEIHDKTPKRSEIEPPPESSTAKVATSSPPAAIAPFGPKEAAAFQAAWAKHLGVPVDFVNGLGMKFVLIPPGEFDMGLPDDLIAEQKKHHGSLKAYQEFVRSSGPRHRVKLTTPFYLGVHEITQAAFAQVMGKRPSAYSESGWEGGANPFIGVDTGKLPVDSVTRTEAREFCRKLGETGGVAYRLPTEAEWEFACRAGSVDKNWFGESLAESAWTRENNPMNRLLVPQPVALLRPNPFGLYDMIGNISEMCEDNWAVDYYDLFKSHPAIDPQGPTKGEKVVVRGGCFLNPEYMAHSGYRSWIAGAPSNVIGFRIAAQIGAAQATPSQSGRGDR